MILETAQMLSTAHHFHNTSYKQELYKPTHQNHPSNKWVRASRDNYNWTLDLLAGLLVEYTYRYGKIHATERILDGLMKIPWDLPNEEGTEPPQCMPDEYKVAGDSVAAYRKYYKYGKANLLSYKNRAKPEWLMTTI